MNKLNNFKDTLIFETQKQFYDERGKGARYRMTTVGVSFFKNEIKDLKDTQGISDWLKNNGFCQDISLTDEGIAVKMVVKGCCLKNVDAQFFRRNKQPLSCPLSNLIMHSLELNGSNPPELCSVDFEGDTCTAKIAKMFTSDVVGR